MATDPEITRELEVEKHTGLWLPHVYSTSACNGQKQITDRHTNLAVTFLFFTIPHVWIRWFISQIRQLAYTDDDGLSLIIYGANDTGFFIFEQYLIFINLVGVYEFFYSFKLFGHLVRLTCAVSAHPCGAAVSKLLLPFLRCRHLSLFRETLLQSCETSSSVTEHWPVTEQTTSDLNHWLQWTLVQTCSHVGMERSMIRDEWMDEQE